MGRDRSFTDQFTCVLMVLQCLKNQKKRKQRMKREVYDGNKDKNIKEKVFVIFVFISKIK